MNPLAQVVMTIIKEQQAIIGPLAIEQAKKVTGIEISSVDHIKVIGKGKEVLEELVKQYEKLFGAASVQVCKDAVEPILAKIPPQEIPDILR